MTHFHHDDRLLLEKEATFSCKWEFILDQIYLENMKDLEKCKYLTEACTTLHIKLLEIITLIPEALFSTLMIVKLLVKSGLI